MNGTSRVSLIAIPEAMVSTLGGIYDVLNAFPGLSYLDDALPATAPFEVEIVGPTRAPVSLASGIPIKADRGFAEIALTDIVIVPSLLIGGGAWQTGRYPELVAWLADMYRRGATLCSACSGAFLIAETGLLDGVETTIHWSYAATFTSTYPKVVLFPERALIAAGERERLISSGASTSWHDLVLYLIARRVGPTAAQTVAKFYALQTHRDGLAPYAVFRPPTGHGDAIVAGVQDWLATHFSVASPVEEMVHRSGLAERSFKRRFKAATGLAPIDYVQRLRIEDARRRLELTTAPIDEVGWRVGYEDPAFFRRLFKRVTGMAPGAYRRMYRMPE